MHHARLLFIVKFREDSAGNCAYDGTPNCFGGLYNSALFVVQMLNAEGIRAKLVQVCDNNDIDREVYSWKPTVVIIEGLWVVPRKFEVLERLHPSVQWVVRFHSEIPFLAYEGVAMDWLTRYVLFRNVAVSSNSKYGVRDFDSIIGAAHPHWNKTHLEKKIKYLPNWYPDVRQERKKVPDEVLDVGCFGSIRPLKNQLIQAVAAVEWAKEQRKFLRFHINGRTEQGGESVVKNLRALLPATSNELVEHPWAPREEFLKRLALMDVGMQVSFSETFDITAADTVSLGIPLVTSHEVVWAADISKAIATNVASILHVLHMVTGRFRELVGQLNSSRLEQYSEESEVVWRNFALAE